MIDFGQIMFPEEKNVTVVYGKVCQIMGIPPFKMTTRTSEFDAQYLLVRSILITVGEKLREARGLPPQKDLDLLFKEAAIEFGLETLTPEPAEDQQAVQRLPAPHEMEDENGKFILPRKDCPQCGEKESMTIGPLCHSCKDAQREDGQAGFYKTMWKCQKCDFKDKSTQFFTQILNELKIDFGTGTKESMGIKTFTDEGEK